MDFREILIEWLKTLTFLDIEPSGTGGILLCHRVSAPGEETFVHLFVLIILEGEWVSFFVRDGLHWKSFLRLNLHEARFVHLFECTVRVLCGDKAIRLKTNGDQSEPAT